ncbi:UNVERIFIED_CONTAM: hypothetical protein Slati_1414000 [Sesamum latifolium]|uniref:Transposase-associated domain-containing protein n=1 Tax=Sesamum latifolium TaxID=2727402 RepID=A0AAW2X6L6_9LAMI
MDGEKIRCPCRKCKNKVFKTPDEINFDLYMKGFMSEYYNWTSHGEKRMQEYFEAVTGPHLQDEQNPHAPAEEGTSTNWVKDAGEDEFRRRRDKLINRIVRQMMVRGRVLLMPAIVHIIMAVAPMIMCMGLQIVFRMYCTLSSSPCRMIAPHLNWLLWLSWWI